MISDHQFRMLLDESPDGLLVVDGRGTIHDLNERAAAMFSWPREELMGRSVDVLVPEALRTAHAAHRNDFMANPRTRPMGVGLKLEGERRDGSRFPVEIALGPANGNRRAPLVICTVRDMTEFERWRRLSGAVLAAVEEERRRFAREMHDDIGHQVMSLGARIASTLPESATVEDVLAQIDRIGGEIAAALDRACHDLLPPQLKNLGLTVALQVMCREFSEATGITVRHDDLALVGPALAPARALALFRVVQESLRNVHKHAQTSEAIVTMAADAGRIEIEVKDFGVGYDADAVAAASSRLGHAGMAARMSSIGGTLKIESSPGTGTSVRAVSPPPGDETEEAQT